ncbi:MAG: phospholipase D-like domain-containing protein [Armatimonadota bacterium]|nr:phospholipase D-like domain-containing protein [Armatimonadota bacterium]
MDARIVDNQLGELAPVLESAISQAEDVRLAVAFASANGVRLLEGALAEALDCGAHVELLIGLDGEVTEPDAIRLLFCLTGGSENAHLYCHPPAALGSSYHPKVYWTSRQDAATIVVGSSNLTRGGLSSNAEINVVIDAESREEIVSDTFSAYLRLKLKARTVEADDDLLAVYAELFERQAQHRRAAVGDADARELRRRLQAKLSSLGPATASEQDLVGWLRAVYDVLPEGEFTNQDVYAYEAEFSRLYPENDNVRAKVRQQLQVLRDMGILEHIVRGRWRKQD